MRVALFATCVNDALFPSVARAVVRLLERLGVGVEFPLGQTCCGQPQFNSGYRREAEPLVVRMGRVFAGFDFVVAPSGSCVAMVRERYPGMAVRNPELASAVEGLVPRVLDLPEFLVDVLGVTDVRAYFPHAVVYHPSCHGLRVLGLGARPRRLLEAVRGLELREPAGAGECCGFGGTFAVKNPEVSVAMGADKVAAARASGASVVCGGDSSCLMHLDGIARRQGAGGPRMVHVAEILASTQDDPWSPS